MRGECSRRWAFPLGGFCSEEQYRPRDNDLNPGICMTSYSSRTKNMTYFAVTATESCSPYSPLFTISMGRSLRVIAHQNETAKNLECFCYFFNFVAIKGKEHGKSGSKFIAEISK
jgi:hypothetical protein